VANAERLVVSSTDAQALGSVVWSLPSAAFVLLW
jgi:hypothetical protein